MLPNRAPRSLFSVFALLALLVLASLPAQARPVRHPAAGRRAVAASGENGLVRIWSFLVSLWPQGTKEGMSINPNGATAPSGDLDDEGMTIDPDGRT